MSPAFVTSAPAGLPACAAAPSAPLLWTQRRPGTHPRGLGNGPVEVVGLLAGCPASGLIAACQELHSGDWGRPSRHLGSRGMSLCCFHTPYCPLHGWGPHGRAHRHPKTQAGSSGLHAADAAGANWWAGPGTCHPSPCKYRLVLGAQWAAPATPSSLWHLGR